MNASSLILVTADRKIVLQLRDNKNGVFFRGCWGLIGGAALMEESPQECIIRECIEETGWHPDNLRKVIEMNEHCNETVYASYIESCDNLHCNEGVKLMAFSTKELDNIKIAPYHRRIISHYLSITKNSNYVSKLKVLFYTKVLPPSFGGYVTAGVNLHKLIKQVADVRIVTDADIDFKDSDEEYDLLFFNATYEKSPIFSSLVSRSKQVWTFEHNCIDSKNAEEMFERFNKSSRILVPSEYLKEKMLTLSDKHFFIVPTVFPIPIDTDIFSFKPHKIGDRVKFITLCAIKKIRNLEFAMDIMQDLKDTGLDFQWDIYGDIPYQGDESYLESLKQKQVQSGLSHYIKFHKAIISQEKLAKTLHRADFYIDFATQETYGIAKLEAALSGLRLIIPSLGNNLIFQKATRFYTGSHKEIANQIIDTYRLCIKNSDEDVAMRVRMQESIKKFSVNFVLNTFRKILYETV